MPFIIKSTITETFLERVRITPKLVGFSSKVGDRWNEITFQEFHDHCRLVSFGLMGLGVAPGDKVIILSNTRYEWPLCDMAIMGARAITVPIYASTTAEDSVYIVNHSEAKVAIVENAEQLGKLVSQRQKLPNLGKIIVIESQAMQGASELKDVLTLQALKELGHREEANSPGRFDENLRAAKPNDLITICYTSGTTGIPKGVMLSHDNMMSVIEDTVKAFSKYIRPDEEITVAFLPFSHILGKVESMANYAMGYRECYAESIEKLVENIAEIRPTAMFAVPRIFEKAYARIKTTVDQSPPAKKKLFDWAYETGKRYHDALARGKRPSLKTSLEYATAQKVVFKKIKDRFGGRMKYAICGGAPLPREVGAFFQIVGLGLMEGYGLTETCAPVAVNTPDHFKLGTVGRPLADVSVKIAEDGEILLKSRKVFLGYFKSPDETAEALQDGWFHTGDIGEIDEEGFLRITDRKKDVIITSGGKNVAPQKIENLAKTYKYINQFVVHGDRRNYLTALVTLDRDLIVQYANDHEILFSQYSELVKSPKITVLIQRIIDDLNAHLASFETIKKFIILPTEFTIESGELTPSLKVKRGFINRKYKAELDSMYDSVS